MIAKRKASGFGYNAKGTLICFTGMDGSGKTSHALALIESLKKRRMDSKYIWIRYVPILLRPLISIVKALHFHRKKIYKKDYSKYSDEVKKFFRNPKIALIWRYAIWFDYWFQIYFKINALLSSNKVVVVDRYIFDTVVNFAADMDLSKNEIMKESKGWIFSLFPKPSLVFLLDVPEEIAFKRKDDIPTIEYLVERRKMYLYMAKIFNFIVIDNKKNFENQQKYIQNIVFKKLS